jgi:DUF1680 family protein
VVLKNGFAQVEREWKTGDQLELTLPMPIRRVVANEKVKADRGRIAIERGPVVYCVEGIDNNDSVSNIILGDDAPLKAEFRKDLLGGCTVITSKDLMAIPYALWSNRSNTSKMAVWLERDD